MVEKVHFNLLNWSPQAQRAEFAAEMRYKVEKVHFNLLI